MVSPRGLEPRTVRLKVERSAQHGETLPPHHPKDEAQRDRFMDESTRTGEAGAIGPPEGVITHRHNFSAIGIHKGCK